MDRRVGPPAGGPVFKFSSSSKSRVSASRAKFHGARQPIGIIVDWRDSQRASRVRAAERMAGDAMDTDDRRVDSDGFDVNSSGSDSDSDDLLSPVRLSEMPVKTSPDVDITTTRMRVPGEDERPSGSISPRAGAVPALGKPPGLGLGLNLGAVAPSGAAPGSNVTPLTARKPPGLGLSLGGEGEAPSNSSEPSPASSKGSPAAGVAGLSLGVGAPAGSNRPMGLNLDALRDNSEEAAPESELQIRRRKFDFFEKHCTRVADSLYVAGEAVAKNRATLDEHGITHVINCNAFIIPNYFEPDLAYKSLWLQDTPGEDISCVLFDCFDFIRASHRDGGRVLVHCSQGVSRSASVAISYLMWRDGDTYERTFARVKASRGVANPNMGFTCQLLQWHKRRAAEAAPGGGVDRLHRIAPHSEHDPRYLIAKPLATVSADALDARGAFVVSTASGNAYAWIGPECVDEAHRRRARTFARQLRAYDGLGGIRGEGEGDDAETNDGSTTTTAGGSEPPEVLEALGLDPAAGGWAGAATARVAAYDADFEMYARGERSAVAAKSGAAVPAPEWARALTEAGRADQAAGSGDPAPVLAEGSRSMNEGHAATPKASGLERAVSMPAARSEEARRDEEDVRDEASDDDEDGGDDAPRLREYPSLERLGMYDEDDLDTDGVFVLVRPPKTVHVWIGAGGDTGGEDPDVFGGRAGEECATRLGFAGGHRVHVEREGGESAEFWDAFEAGQ